MTEEIAVSAVDAEPSATPTPPEPTHPEDAASAIDAAFDQVEAEETAAPEAKPAEKVEAKPAEAEKAEAKPAEPTDDGEQLRNPDGTFKAKESEEGEKPPAEPEKQPVEAEAKEKAPETPDEDKGISDAPARFSGDAKGEWGQAPASVRGEINRVMREMESGLAEHQARWEPLKELDALARQHGTDIPTAMRQYIAFEQNIRKDPIAGLTQTCAELGLNFRDIVAEVSGQAPDEVASRHDATVTALQGRITGLESQLGDVSKSIQTQREETHNRDVEAFAAKHSRFEELSPNIAQLLQTGMAGDLPEAYGMAELLKPVPAPASPPAAQTRDPAPAQTRQAALSITGAPVSGSNPATRKPPASADEAIDNAFAQVVG